MREKERRNANKKKRNQMDDSNNKNGTIANKWNNKQ